MHFVSIYFSCISLNLKARTDFSILPQHNRWGSARSQGLVSDKTASILANSLLAVIHRCSLPLV
jgi:hypothetical protein